MNDKKILTIITPTYNRKEEIEKLYISLCEQSNKNFTWLVVDDGSSDGTEEKIIEWKKEKLIDIEYLLKKNGGKHTALNLGIKNIETSLTFIVDSDDRLMQDAVQIICTDFQNVDMNGICGLAYLRQSQNGSYLTNKLVPIDGLKESFCKCRYGRNIKGDMAEVWVTDCLKEYPFPEFPNEKFISEDVVWIAMSLKYEMFFFNKAIYMSDYLEGGLTVNRRKHNMKSPLGCMYRGELQLDAHLPVKYKIRAMMYYIVYGKFAGFSNGQLYKRSKHKVLYILMIIFGTLIYKKWKKEM